MQIREFYFYMVDASMINDRLENVVKTSKLLFDNDVDDVNFGPQRYYYSIG